MKKLFCALMLCLISISSFSQKVTIVTDENMKDSRTIATNYQPLVKKGLVEIPFSLMYLDVMRDGEPYYALTFEVMLGKEPLTLPAGSKMYLKLDNDSIIELETINDIETFDNKRVYQDYCKCMIHYMYPSYLATPEQIQMMIDHRVVKIRRQITWGEGFYDIPNEQYFKPKHMIFTESLVQMKQAIDERLHSVKDENDILQNF